VTVLLSTYNPHAGRLARTLQGLWAQKLPMSDWELILVDNASTTPLDPVSLGLARHPFARLVREVRLGLVYGRMAGLAASRSDLIVFCDDDMVLATDYLSHAVDLFAADAELGNASGKILPAFEQAPPAWTEEFHDLLALRDFGDDPRIGDRDLIGYPDFAFGGGGAVFRRAALASVLPSVAEGAEAGIRGRTGGELSSGEDNHILLSLLKQGWKIGYFPNLVVTHLIPPTRLTRDYLGRLNHGIARSWVQVLARHEICPWASAARWSLRARKLRAYLRYRAWAGPAEHVRWRGACGHFEGRVLIGSHGPKDAP
jgi:glycosyltransferase involved in cell wall biosynthesis